MDLNTLLEALEYTEGQIERIDPYERERFDLSPLQQQIDALREQLGLSPVDRTPEVIPMPPADSLAGQMIRTMDNSMRNAFVKSFLRPGESG